MNLILVDRVCHKHIFRKTDRRAIQIKKILGSQTSGELYVGCASEKAMGKAMVSIDQEGNIELETEWATVEERALSEHEVTRGTLNLIVPFCRPQTCRKILREAASLGIRNLWFFQADKSEKEYAKSSLWKSGEWQELLFRGIEQAFDPEIPRVELVEAGLQEVLNKVDKRKQDTRICGIALDNYEAQMELQQAVISGDGLSLVVSVGPERGWSSFERDIFKAAGHKLVHMGHRVMRTETAVTAACAVVSAVSGLWMKGDTSQFLKSRGIEGTKPQSM